MNENMLSSSMSSLVIVMVCVMVFIFISQFTTCTHSA